MATNLAAIAKARNIEYFLISFVDLLGHLRAKLVPAVAIGGMQKTGAGFAGFAAWLDMTPADPDMFAIPDPDSLIQLPWKPEVGWVGGRSVDEWQARGGITPGCSEAPTGSRSGERLSRENGCGMRIFPA